MNPLSPVGPPCVGVNQRLQTLSTGEIGVGCLLHGLVDMRCS